MNFAVDRAARLCQRRVQPMLVGPDGHSDWVAKCEVDLVQSRQKVEPVLRLRRIGSPVLRRRLTEFA
ncbi:MAG TPA: hypothetical protein VI136_01650 [Verrucomicrobiae bacterium]